MEFIRENGEAMDIERCDECNAKMVNLDKDDLTADDLRSLKRYGLRFSSPETEDLICSVCENPDSKISRWSQDDDDDGFLGDLVGIIGGGILGSLFESGGDGGGFGGFGGGGFGGGGASRGF